MLLNVDLAAAGSISEILEKLEEKNNHTPVGEFILGLNFNYDIVKERRLPTRQELDELSATPLLWVQPLDRDGNENGDPLVCADGTRMAGPGQIIYWVASREAALSLDPWFVPVDDAIVGLVDEVRNYPPEELDG